MSYVVGALMLVAGIVCLDLGRRYLRPAGKAPVPSTFVSGELIALIITFLFGGGATTLLAGVLTQPSAASLGEFGAAVALVVLATLGYFRLVRRGGAAVPA